MKKVFYNYKKKYIWFWLSIATFNLAGFTSTVPKSFDILPDYIGALKVIDDMPMVTLEIIVAIFTLYTSLFHIKTKAIKSIRTASMMFVWVLFFLGLISIDIATGIFSLGLGFTVVIIGLILAHAYMEGD
ncbi:hypothetical protein [Companilactobacillus metriopterae]|uniref:hypothetical protein n=1 Tax=Companilactobacillus metriopterae TaxID=1909267 RepID=UPI00100B705D|nr:hypothetical protein [Companilactobacillus metriopterae]